MIKKMCIALIIVFAPAIYAQNASQSLTQLLNNVKSMQANFTEKLLDKAGKGMQKSKGLMQLRRPGKFRWQITSPNPQLIVTNGHKLWIYDPDLEQVTIRLLTKEAGEAPALLLSSTITSLEKEFIVAEGEVQNGIQWFQLTPKDKSSMFEMIKLGFQNQTIKKMQLQDNVGHITQIDFLNVKTNVSLAPSLFNFKAPKNIDVIDESK